MSNVNNRSTFYGKDDDVKPVIDNDIKVEFGKILKTLLVDYNEYEPINTYQAIADYLSKYNELNVVYYASITNLIYFDDECIGNLFANIDKCLSMISNTYESMRAANEKNCVQIAKIYRFVIKLSDHISLAGSQVDKIVHTVVSEAVVKIDELSKKMDKLVEAKSAEILNNMDNKVENQSEILISDMNKVVNRRLYSNQIRMKKYYKGLEKDSITIMGIFVAIVLAFTGSTIIPTNLVNNAADIGAAKLVLLLSGIAFIFINMLYQLIRFILIINDKSVSIKKLYDISVINVILIIVFASSLFFL